MIDFLHEFAKNNSFIYSSLNSFVVFDLKITCACGQPNDQGTRKGNIISCKVRRRMAGFYNVPLSQKKMLPIYLPRNVTNLLCELDLNSRHHDHRSIYADRELSAHEHIPRPETHKAHKRRTRHTRGGAFAQRALLVILGPIPHCCTPIIAAKYPWSRYSRQQVQVNSALHPPVSINRVPASRLGLRH